MITILQILKLIGGVLLLIAPFTKRFRQDSAPWVKIAVPLAGALTEIHVVVTHQLEAFSAVSNSQYWLTLSNRSFLGGTIIGILLCILMHSICTRFSKSNKAKPAG